MSLWVNTLSELNLQISPSSAKWIEDPSSTTAKFEQLGIAPYIRVLKQKPHTHKNASYLSIAFERHVSIDAFGENFMLASTFLSTANEHVLQTIENLGDQPIGNLIFKKMNLTRSAFQFSDQIPPWQKTLTKITTSNYISRCSYFENEQLRVILFESFAHQHPLYSENYHV